MSIFDSKCILFDRGFSMKDWSAGDEIFVENDSVISFDIKHDDGSTKSFDVVFDFCGQCKWYYEKGDFYQPDFWEPVNMKIDITIKEFISEDFTLDILKASVKVFNNRVNRMTGMSPNNAFKDENREKVLRKLETYYNQKVQEIKILQK